MPLYEVIALDWSEPNVIASFTDREAADDHAERMDGAALRCYVREVPEPLTDLATVTTIAEFFAEYDKRVATVPEFAERCGWMRPVLASNARHDPEGFVRVIVEFFAEKGLA